jgi:hypothetical protein
VRRGDGDSVGAQVLREALAPAATLVRINVREPEVPPGGIGLAMGALEALKAMDQAP